MNPILGVFLFATLIIWMGFRPRRPWVIHAYMNRIFLNMFFAIEIMVGGIPLWIYISGVLFHEQLFRYFAIGMISLVLLTVLATIYILYWEPRFSRKKKRVNEVDTAIEHYRRPNEKVDGALLSDLIVDGKAYSLVYYRSSQEENNGFLGFDLQGQVVKDEDLMKKLGQCLRLAMAIVYPDQINRRTKSYMDTQKMLKMLNESYKKYGNLVKPLSEKSAKQVQDVKDALVIIREYATSLCKMWYLEAEWGQKHGNTHLQQVRYEDVLELTSQMNAYQFMTEQTEIMFRGIDAAHDLSKRITRIPGKPPAAFKELYSLLTLVVGFKKTAQLAKLGEQPGTSITKYMPLTEDDLKGWRKRLEWVEKVDGKKPPQVVSTENTI